MPDRFRRFYSGLVAACLICSLAAPVNAKDSATEFVIGDVYDQQSGQLLYREFYHADAEGRLALVVYRLPDGDLLAEKTISPLETPGLVSFRMQNFLAERSFGITVERPASAAGAKELQLRMFQQSGNSRKESTVAVDDAEPLVVDAGFDAFVRHHWDSLLAGDEKDIQFALATSSRLVDMVVGETGCEQEATVQICFSIRLRSLLLNWMMSDPVLLVYDRDSRLLQRYRGVGNVALQEGKPSRIDIIYRYPDPLAADQASSNSKISRGS